MSTTSTQAMTDEEQGEFVRAFLHGFAMVFAPPIVVLEEEVGTSKVSCQINTGDPARVQRTELRALFVSMIQPRMIGSEALIRNQGKEKRS